MRPFVVNNLTMKEKTKEYLKYRHVVGYGVAVVVVGWLVFGDLIVARLPHAEAVSYRCISLECQLEAMARDIYQQREGVNLERARLEAIEIMGARLIESTEVSPFVDYAHIREVINSIDADIK